MYPNVIKSSGLTHYWHVRQPKPSTPEEARLDALFERNVYTTDLEVRRRTYHDIATIMNERVLVRVAADAAAPAARARRASATWSPRRFPTASSGTWTGSS